MKVLCVLNPSSGHGLTIQRWPEVVALLKSFSIEHELLSATDVPIDIQVARRLEQGGIGEFQAVAGIGGDGTQSAVINGMMAYRSAHPDAELPPYCFVPMGVGNDIAKSFGFASRSDFFVDDLRRAVSTIAHGADYWLDLGVINGRYFADALTIGLDSAILKGRNRRKRLVENIPMLRWIAGSPVLYVFTWAMGFRFWREPSVNAEVRIDDAVWYSGPILNLVINNTRIYAGEFDFCPGAFSNDGLLDLILFTTGHIDYLSRYLLSLRYHPRSIRKMANYLSSASTHAQGRHIVVSLSKVEAAQLDGEEIPSSDKFDILVIPRAIHIKIPAEP